MTTTGRVEQLLSSWRMDLTSRRCSRRPRDQVSAVGRTELLADVGGRSNCAASGLNNHATFLELADASV